MEQIEFGEAKQHEIVLQLRDEEYDTVKRLAFLNNMNVNQVLSGMISGKTRKEAPGVRYVFNEATVLGMQLKGIKNDLEEIASGLRLSAETGNASGVSCIERIGQTLDLLDKSMTSLAKLADSSWEILKSMKSSSNEASADTEENTNRNLLPGVELH